MSLTLKEVLDLDTFADIRLLAGGLNNGLNRTVSGINIIEVPDVSRWMKGGEILCSSGYVFKGDADLGCQLIRDLNVHNISALIIKPGPYLKEIPQKMKLCANQLDFPLLQMPEDRPYSFYMEALYEVMLDRQVDILQYAFILRNQMFTLAVNSTTKDLCRFISESLQQSLFLFDDEGRLLYEHDLQQQDIAKELYQTLSCYGMDYMEAVKDMTVKLANNPVQLTYSDILLPHGKQARLVMIHNKESQRELSKLVIPFAAQLIQMQEEHRQSLSEKEYEVAGALLLALIEENYNDPSIVIERGKMFQVDLTANLVLFIIEIELADKIKISSNSVNATKENKQSFLHQKILSAIHNLVVSKLHHILSLKSDNSIAVLAEMRAYDNEDTLRKLIIEPLEEFSKSLKDLKISVGSSRFACGMENIPKLYSQARTSLRIARASDAKCSSEFYAILGLSRLLPELENSAEMKELLKETIGPILEYDRANKTSFMNTLVTLYHNNGNVSQSSRDLFIHKNTLLNHLEIINNLLGCDVRDSEYMSVFNLCLKYLKHTNNLQ